MPRGRSWGLCAIPLLVGLAASIDANTASDNSAGVEALAGDASGAPPEFAADLFIRIAGSANLDDPARQRELLENAFMRAYGAQESYKRAAPMVPFDSQAGWSGAGHENTKTRRTDREAVSCFRAFVARRMTCRSISCRIWRRGSWPTTVRST
jgi:hypothetical protein